MPETPARVYHVITRMIVGGAQENTLYTCALLDKQRYQTRLISGAQTGSEGSLLEETRTHGIDLLVLNDLVRQIHPLKDLRALIQLYRLFRQNQVHIVHTHSSKAGILGRLAARLAHVPIIVHTVHGWSFHEHMSPVMRHIYILLERWMARFTHALIVVAQQDTFKGLAAHIGEKRQYQLIRSAIPLEIFDVRRYHRDAIRKELDIPIHTLVVGNVGRFSAQKNPLTWIQTAAEIARKNQETFFLLVGDGPLRPQVEARLRDLGLQDRTRLTGLRRDVPRMLAAMDIFLLTSLWEGLPRVLPQALAMGLPIVAHRIDGISDIVEHGVNGYLCPPDDINALSQSCLTLIENASLRQQMAERARASVRKDFDLRTMIAQIDQLYERLLSQEQNSSE